MVPDLAPVSTARRLRRRSAGSFSAREHAPGCPELRSASADPPLRRPWPGHTRACSQRSLAHLEDALLVVELLLDLRLPRLLEHRLLGSPPGWSKAGKWAALEAASSSSRGSGQARRAARRAMGRDRSRAGALLPRLHFEHAGPLLGHLRLVRALGGGGFPLARLRLLDVLRLLHLAQDQLRVRDDGHGGGWAARAERQVAECR